jgi:LPXTG-site transpeptidase (sortase) family protein
LKNGDQINVFRNGRKFKYVVSSSFVVTKHALWILKPTSNSTLTLFSCHPVGKTSHRYVIRATFVS